MVSLSSLKNDYEHRLSEVPHQNSLPDLIWKFCEQPELHFAAGPPRQQLDPNRKTPREHGKPRIVIVRDGRCMVEITPN
jgi:hypothetical protein